MPFRIVAAITCLVCLAAGGCLNGKRGIIESPLTISEQQSALLRVVPLGTPREQVEQLLGKAGIEYVKAPRETVIHCTVWNQPGGERWHINVALLFDRNKELYAVRESDARIELSTEEQNPAAASLPWGRTTGSAPPGANPAPTPDGDEPRRAFAAP
jgi:hypothetical protein